MTSATPEAFGGVSGGEDRQAENGAFHKIAETAGSLAGKGAEALGKIGAMASEKWEQVKAVAGEWRDDITEAVQMQTTEKWKFASERDGANKLINLKMGDIDRLKAESDTTRLAIPGMEAARADEAEKFNKALESIKDPVMAEIFTRNRDQKDSDAAKEIEAAQASIEAAARTQGAYESEIAGFKSKVETAGSAFEKKIDDRIGKIHEKCGYDEKMQTSRALEDQIGKNREVLDASTERQKQHEDALSLAKELKLNKDDIAGIEAGLQSLRKENELLRKVIERASKAKAKVDGHIAKINSKTAKWQKLKDELGLGKNAEAADRGEEPSAEAAEAGADRDAAEDEGKTEEKPEEEQPQEQEENQEPAPYESREGHEKASAELNALYKMIRKDGLKSIDLVKQVRLAKEAVLADDTVFQDEAEKERLMDGFKLVQERYDQRGIESATDQVEKQLKKDIFNKIIRRVPDSVEIDVE